MELSDENLEKVSGGYEKRECETCHGARILTEYKDGKKICTLCPTCNGIGYIEDTYDRRKKMIHDVEDWGWT